jgi:hypothetical protein
MTKEQVYDEQINPLMAQIIQICQTNNIPFAFSAQLTTDEEDEDGALFCSTFNLPDGTHQCLKDAASLIYRQRPKVLSMIITKPHPTGGDAA